jgi:hypothetical protein
LEALEKLAGAGTAVDRMLVAAESDQAASQGLDERVVQTLGGFSREIWTAHKATLKAIAASHQYDGIIPPTPK